MSNPLFQRLPRGPIQQFHAGLDSLQNSLQIGLDIIALPIQLVQLLGHVPLHRTLIIQLVLELFFLVLDLGFEGGT